MVALAWFRVRRKTEGSRTLNTPYSDCDAVVDKDRSMQLACTRAPQFLDISRHLDRERDVALTHS